MMTKYIYLFLLIVFSISNGQGQSLCPPKGISTNPDNPINTHNPNMENDFFNWTQEDFQNYFNPNFPTTIQPGFNTNSLYWQQTDYLNYISGYNPATPGVNTRSDFSPIEGWELLQRGFGKFINGSANPDFYNPYFLLYNKYTGILRLWFMIPTTSYVDAGYQTFDIVPNSEAPFHGEYEGYVESAPNDIFLIKIKETGSVAWIENLPNGCNTDEYDLLLNTTFRHFYMPEYDPGIPCSLPMGLGHLEDDYKTLTIDYEIWDQATNTRISDKFIGTKI
jgi:hypothetical protein